MKTIFEPVSIGKLTLKNRIVRSATFENAAYENGEMTPLLEEIYHNLAQGEVGLIITGMIGIGPNSCMSPEMGRTDVDSFPDNLRKLQALVQESGGRLVVQLGQCGAKSTVIDRGEYAYAPSDTEVIRGTPAKAMTHQEIALVTKEFGAAAKRCQEAGADGVQLHGAHGYLLSQFLSPWFNKREDEYGGSIENRARFLFAVYDEIRSQVGPDYPILIKINDSDLTTPGLSSDECLWVCRELEKRGLDGIELSAGIAVDRASRPGKPVADESEEGTYADGALRLASELAIPIISVGGYRTPAVIEKLLNQGDIAAISLSRPLIREPDLVRRWRQGDRTKGACISCNRCFTSKIHGCKLIEL